MKKIDDSVFCSFKHTILPKNTKKLWPLFCAILFAACALIAQVIPPLQSPDENSHLSRAYAITQGDFFLDTRANESSGLKIDYGLLYFIDGYMQFITKSKSEISQIDKDNLAKQQWQFESVHIQQPGTGYYNPLVYMPQAMGLWLGQAFKLSILNSYKLARLITTFVVLFLIALSFSLYRPNPLVFGLVLLPMSIFQILMPTIDGLSHGLTLLCLCWFFAARGMNFDLKKYLLFAFLIVFLITTRIHALPLLLLLFIVNPINSISKTRRWTIFLISFSAVILWAGWALMHTTDLRVVRSLSTLKIIEFYLSNPVKWAEIFYNTLSSQEIWLHYGKTFIGVLGWLKLSLPEWYYLYCAAILVVLAVISLPKLNFLNTARKLEHSYFFVLAILSALIVWNMLLFTWTPFPNDVIGGVQGRYFWIPACIFAFGLGSTAVFSKSLNFLLAIICMISFATVFFVYYNAY